MRWRFTGSMVSCRTQMHPDAGAGGDAPGRMEELNQAGQRRLMSVIGEAPDRLMSLEQLRRGLCRAYILGPLDAPLAAAVQPNAFPGDISVYGNDAQATFALMRQLDGWEAADVEPAQARHVAEWLGWATRRSRAGISR